MKGLELRMTFAICVLLFFSQHGVCERLVYTLTAEVGSGNITHYSLKTEGSVTLILNSIIGDADIYISENNAKPDYLDYDLHSATCGQDIVTIPKEFQRPVGIGIFGHVYYPVSKYELTVVMDYNASISDQERGSLYSNFFHGEKGTSESTLWVIFVNVLKIILENLD